VNDTTGSNRNLRCARALAVVATAAVLTAGCGVVHVHFGSSAGPSSTVPGTYQQQLAYAQCVRSHGLPDFPLPSPSGGAGVSWQMTASPGSPMARASDACEHLLSGATGS
jgi:uncharacterized protein YceK